MSSLNDLKKELESTLLITEWSPTENQLRLISKGIKALGSSPTKSDIEKVVLSIIGSYGAMLLEGVDYSDLTALLILATKVESEND